MVDIVSKDRRQDGTRALLSIAVAVPFLYFGTLFVGGLLYPGYSHVTQYASELGSAQARYPRIFNGGIGLTALACIAASLGFARGVKGLGGSRVLGWLAAASLALFGLALILGALFPMPDPRHGGWGLGMAIQLTPFFLAAALWKVEEARRLKVFLLVVGVAMALLFVVMMGVGAMVTRANVGLFQRAYTLTLFSLIGIAGYAMLRLTTGPGPVAGSTVGR